ncbi:MAG: hypothetical protein ABEK04_05380 [Candidatus Nanohalobium sp.]
MQEFIEQAINSPQVQYLLENPDVAAAGTGAGAVALGALTGFAGQVRGEWEIEFLNEEYDDREAYEQAVLERKEELAEEIERDSALREVYNHMRHAYTSGKLGAFEEEEIRIKGSDFGTDGEFYNQKFSDEDLEYLD